MGLCCVCICLADGQITVERKICLQLLRSSYFSQAVTEGAASIEERVESLRKLCETLTPKKSSCLATDQLSESDEVEETQPRDAAVPANRSENANVKKETEIRNVLQCDLLLDLPFSLMETVLIIIVRLLFPTSRNNFQFDALFDLKTTKARPYFAVSKKVVPFLQQCSCLSAW